MDKIIAHIKNNASVYFVIIGCLIVLSIVLLMSNKDNSKKEEVDTRYFKILSINETLNLFDSNEEKILVIGKKDCPATVELGKAITVAKAKYGFTINYLELTELDPSSTEYKSLIEKLNFEYTLYDKTDKFGNFLGNTPMLIIIKGRQMSYGYIGNMTLTSLETILRQYGVINETN